MLKKVLAEFEINIPDNITPEHMSRLTNDYIALNRFVTNVFKVTLYPPNYVLHTFEGPSKDQ